MCLSRASKVDAEDADTFDLMTEEIVELRLREHESRLKGRSTSKYAPIVLRVSHANGRPILRFDRERQSAVPEGATNVRVDGHRYTFDFVKIAVNKAVGDIHLFVRYKGKPPAFTYCGPVQYLRHESEKPMRVWFRMERPLPEGLWRAWAP